jgi:outer membrane protein TolC
MVRSASVVVLFLFATVCAGQQPDAPNPTPAAASPVANARANAASAPSSDGRVRLTLQQALELARKNEPQYQSAITQAGLAREDRVQSRDALLPSVSFNTSDLYTQPNQAGTVRYIANNTRHEYISQGTVHESLDLASIASYRSTAALAAVAKARAEIASRGLTVTVVQDYFGVAAAEQKLLAAQRTADEGEKFLNLTTNLEKGGEVAHSDVIKAELQAQDRRRQLKEAQLAALNARLDLAVLIFPNFNDNFEIAEDLHSSVPLPPQAEFEAQAGNANPDIRAALANSQAAGNDVLAAKAGYLPSITIDYFYGIDAANYALYSVVNNQQVPNLGSSALFALSLPVWNWGATQSRVRQAELKRDLAKRELSYAQRKLLAEMRSLYSEAETSLNELAGLQRSSELAADSLRLVTLRYQNGESTVLEVVDAQTTFALANAAYQDGALRYRVALANLQTLTGVLTVP